MRKAHAHRHAGIIGLFSQCHMPINKLFKEEGVRVFFPISATNPEASFFIAFSGFVQAQVQSQL